MSAPAVVDLSGLNENAATSAGGTGTVSFQLIMPISGQDGIVYAMANPQIYVMAVGAWVGGSPSLRSTDMTASFYKVVVELDDWQEVFSAPLPASVTTLAGMRALATSDAPPLSLGLVPWALVGVPGGIATLGPAGTLAVSQRTAYAAGVGLLDASLLVDSGLSGAQTLASGVYQNKIFNVDGGLTISNDNTVLVNCRIVADTTVAVRMDANTGLEVGRRLVNCEIVNPGGRAIGGAGFSAIRVLGKQLGDDFALVGRSHAESTFFDNCACNSFRPGATVHFDGVQVVTTPAAPVIVRGCDFNMNLDAGYVAPLDSGSTGAIFFDPSDVPIGGGDPDPDRVGKMYVIGCRLQSNTGNYTLVIAGEGCSVIDCSIGTGTTGTENLTAAHVSGWGNTDLAGNPLRTDVHGTDLGDYLIVGDPRGGSGGGSSTFAGLTDVNVAGVANGQVPAFNATSHKWEPVDQAVGGGGGGTRMTIISGSITTGNTAPSADTGGAWLPIPGTSRSIATLAGEQVAAEYSYTVDSQTTTFYDIGVVVAGAVVRALHCPTFPPGATYEGMAEFVPDNPSRFIGSHIIPWFIAQAGDISGGNVTFCVCRKSNGSGSFDMNDDLPVRYTLYNNH